ncbi:MAG TPA: class I SAM-dependent methyltransferase [Firmicutes bacterium]|nr:class I SAM-dependent methyltransferase [Bacillota bacterium]
MSSNQDQVFEKYRYKIENGRENSSRNDALEFHYTKKHLEGLITKNDRVLEIGCGTGYYGFYYADQCREYVGIDLFPPHIELFHQRIEERNLKNVSCQVGDATNLGHIPDSSFDVVLSLGPMYHLPEDERKCAFSEAARICKPGGILAFAYIVSVGTYAGSCVAYDDERHIYPNAEATEYVFEQGTDDLRPGLFYYTMPAEIEEMAAQYGLGKIKNLGTNFMFAAKFVNDMTDERFELMRPIYDKMASSESCTGLAGHALLVCTKYA